MAKSRKYKRRGRKHADSSYRKGTSKTYTDDKFSEKKSRKVTDSQTTEGVDRVVGPYHPLDTLMMTKRGKRIHLIDGNINKTSKEDPSRGVKDYLEDSSKWHLLSALCGAGRPNKEFPRGSSIPLREKLSDNLDQGAKLQIEADGVQMTCYRCLKLDYMRDMSNLKRVDGSKIDVITRDFFPTHEGNRSKHVMVPAGRRGVFGANAGDVDREEKIWGAIEIDDENDTISNYDEYFAESRWTPGIEEKRTQPSSLVFIGNRTPQQIKELLKVTSKRESFGQLIQETLGSEIYDGLYPQGSSVDNDIAWDKLVSLSMLRQDIASRNYQRATKRGKFSRKDNPLIGLSSNLLDGIEMFLRSDHVKSRR